eukprot:756215-Hanusia_phi.AAC.5
MPQPLHVPDIHLSVSNVAHTNQTKEIHRNSTRRTPLILRSERASFHHENIEQNNFFPPRTFQCLVRCFSQPPLFSTAPTEGTGYKVVHYGYKETRFRPPV